MMSSPQMPEPEANGWVPTLNQYGFMYTELDEYCQAFVDFAPNAPGPVLEIGAAYEGAVIAALNTGAHVIANDIDPQHLAILTNRTPEALRHQLTLNTQSFPQEMNFNPNSLGAILIARVLHFYPGEIIEAGLQKMAQWLAPDGKVFITAETPYLKYLTHFHATYETRKQQGDPWPGWVDNMRQYGASRWQDIPEHMNLLDPDILNRLCQQVGLEPEKTGFMPRPQLPKTIQFDGREGVGIIAVKSHS